MAYLFVYFAQIMSDGALGITTEYGVFERNYLIPVLIFGMTIAVTAATIMIYHKLRKKNLIGKKYILLAAFNILPLWFISIEQVGTMIYYWEWIYQK